MNSPFRLTVAALLLPLSSIAQSVGIGTATPASSAALEVKSTTQGLLLPRMSAAERAAIAGPTAGLLVFQTDGSSGIYYYNGGSWVNLTNGRVPDAQGSTNTGTVSTLAGSPGSTGSADGAGSTAQFEFPMDIAVDESGTLYVADAGSNTIRQVTPAGVVTTLAGLAGSPGSADGTGAAARFSGPTGVALGPDGVLYVADNQNGTIRKVTRQGQVTTFAGTAGMRNVVDGNGTNAQFYSPFGLAVDKSGNVYVTESMPNVVRKITAQGSVTTFAGTPGPGGHVDDTGLDARFQDPRGIAVDGTGNLYVTDWGSRTLRRITPQAQVTTLATTTGSNTPLSLNPTRVAVDQGGLLYVTEGSSKTILKVTPAGVVSTVAGAGPAGGYSPGSYLDAVGPAARFQSPYGITVDRNGTVYITDASGPSIRVIR